MRRDSTAYPTPAARLHWSPWSAALIARARFWDILWSLRRRASILLLIRLQVSGEIQACCWRSCQGGLGMALWSSANMQSALSGVAMGLIGNLVRFPR